MIKKKKKEITLDDLAGMVQRGFVGVDKRFDKVETRLDGVEERLKNVEIGQEDIKLRLDNVAYRFELKQLDERVTSLERKMTK